MCDYGARNLLLDGKPEISGGPTAEALVPAQPLSTRGPIYKIPLEILFRILKHLVPPPTRDCLYTLVQLTHVCRFWRIALTNAPQAWATIFATRIDRRGFVEMCLERSHPLSLEVTVDAYDRGPVHPSCTCKKMKQSRLHPNLKDPCEWHFAFESLTNPKHWKRIHTLNIRFGDKYLPYKNQIRLALKRSWFFNLLPFQLTDLRLDNSGRPYTDLPFSSPPFPPTLRSLSLRGSWHAQLVKLNTLTSFTFSHYGQKIHPENFRTFILNNQSLETLSLTWIKFEGRSDKPPVTLSSLKSFTVCFPSKAFSTLVRVPALQRLSSLVVSPTGDYRNGWFNFRAAGDQIAFTVVCSLDIIADVWQDLAGYAKPIIRHACLENSQGRRLGSGKGHRMITLFTNVHTLEIGRGYAPNFYPEFWNDLKRLGPQLKTIRFEIPEETEPFRGSSKGYDICGGKLLDVIEGLVAYRSEHKRPFSAVERMVASENERVNRRQDLVWKYFYNERYLDQYIEMGR